MDESKKRSLLSRFLNRGEQEQEKESEPKSYKVDSYEEYKIEVSKREAKQQEFYEGTSTLGDLEKDNIWMEIDSFKKQNLEFSDLYYRETVMGQEPEESKVQRILQKSKSDNIANDKLKALKENASLDNENSELTGNHKLTDWYIKNQQDKDIAAIKDGTFVQEPTEVQKFTRNYIEEEQQNFLDKYGISEIKEGKGAKEKGDDLEH